jgi:hypothetical protein
VDAILVWWLSHDAASLAVAWLAGTWLAHRQRQRWLTTAFGGLLLALAISLLPGQQGLNALLRQEHWIGLAAIAIGSPRRGEGRPGLASMAPMVLATQGLGALILAATIAGKALLERGAPARGWLLGAIGLLSLAALMDDQLLWLWDRSMRLTGLGGDPASLLARACTELVRLAGWGAMLRWSVGGQPRRLTPHQPLDPSSP